MKVLVVVLALGLAFWGYAYVYRGRTEPPAKYLVTNQDAAVYSLRGQLQMLSQQEELNNFAFDGRKKEKERKHTFNAPVFNIQLAHLPAPFSFTHNKRTMRFASSF